MSLIVQKYGGSSVADAHRIKNVARRVIRTSTLLTMDLRSMGQKTISLTGAQAGIRTNSTYKQSPDHWASPRSASAELGKILR